jgi:2-C-methyl-D-erythritol 4-phosphate cytidylyltransferase
MRCCLRTLDEAMEVQEELCVEGQTLKCLYDGDNRTTIVYRDGAWEWQKPQWEKSSHMH